MHFPVDAPATNVVAHVGRWQTKGRPNGAPTFVVAPVAKPGNLGRNCGRMGQTMPPRHLR